MASVFSDKHIVPDNHLLAKELGASQVLFKQFVKFAENEYPPVTTEWKHYGQNSGWLLKIYSGKRNLCFVIPGQGFFSLTFIFGDKAVDFILKDTFPEHLKNELSNARKYMEGRGLRLEIREENDLIYAKKLINVKIKF